MRIFIREKDFREAIFEHDEKIRRAEERARIRSKTFPGIAKAMAEQWG